MFNIRSSIKRRIDSFFNLVIFFGFFFNWVICNLLLNKTNCTIFFKRIDDRFDLNIRNSRLGFIFLVFFLIFYFLLTILICSCFSGVFSSFYFGNCSRCLEYEFKRYEKEVLYIEDSILDKRKFGVCKACFTERLAN